MSAATRHRDWLAESDFTLVLSAGFFGFFAHTGVLLALEAAGLRPRRVVGVSAGALAGGLWAAGVSAATLAAALGCLSRKDFWDPALSRRGLLRGGKFDQLLRGILAPVGVERVEACPVPFAPVVHDRAHQRAEVVERGDLATAIRASCAVPYLFWPVPIDGRDKWDGGVSDRAGATAVGPDERLFYHHLPHTSPWPEFGADPLRHQGERRRVLSISGLPRVSPFRLGAGPRALEVARRRADLWLDETSSA